MPIVEIADLQDPNLAPYKTLRRQSLHLRQGIFVAEGPTVVERLLRSEHGVISALLTREWLERLEPAFFRRRSEVTIFVAEKRLLAAVTGFQYHQGVMAVGRCPPEPALPEVLRETASPRLLIAFDGLTSAENVGLALRSCAALGATAVLSGEGSCSPYLRRAVRVSMGGVLFVPVLHAADLAATLAELRSGFGFRLVAAEAHGGTPLESYAFRKDACVVFGHESEGLSAAVRRVCDDSVTVPLSDRLDSLNVAAAITVFLYEFRNQHGRKRRELAQ